MRKIYLFMLTLLSAVGAWATVSDLKVSDGSHTYYYLIKNCRSGMFAKWASDNAQLLQSSDLTDANLWYVTTDGSGYKLCNKATTNKYATTSSFTAEGATVYIAENKHKSGYWCVSLKADQSANCWDDQSGKIGDYAPTSSDNEGTSWTFVLSTGDANRDMLGNAIAVANASVGTTVGCYPQKAIDAAQAVYESTNTSEIYAQATTTLQNAQVLPVKGKYYTITSAFPGYMTNQSVTKSVYVDGGILKWKTTDLADPTMYWEIYKDGSKYVFKNYSTGTFISRYANGYYVGEIAAANSGFTWLDGGQCNIGIAGGNFHTESHGNGSGVSGKVIKYGSGKDNASSWYIIEVEVPDYVKAKAALQSQLNELNNKVGVNPGQYTLSGGITSAEYESAINDAENVVNGTSTNASDYTSALTTLNNALASATYTQNDMVVGKYYRIQNTAHTTYTGVQRNNAKTGESKMWNYALNENDPGQIWKLEQDGENYYLVNVLSGLYPQYVNGGETATTYLGAKDARYKFTHNIYSEASSTAYPRHRIYFGGRQVNVETAGYVNWWFENNARHHIWTVEKTDDEILALAKEWVNTQNLTANANASKIDVTPGVTQVISPNEFADPEVVNAAIEALKAYTSAGSNPTLEQAQAVWNNASIVNTYKTNADNNGGLMSMVYTLKAKYGTIILPINYSKPTNVKLYSCNAAEGSVLTLTEYASGETKNKPFIIEYTDEESLPTAEAPKKYQFIGYKSGAGTENVTEGWLTGVLSDESTTVSAGNYVLSKYNGKLGFYKVGESANVTCPQYKCYLSKGASARAFYFDDEDVETGINAVEIEEVVPADAAIYDLSGRRVQSAKSGLYIVNGKKIIK